MAKCCSYATLLCCWIFSVSIGAQVCKWVDEQGVTHYASECPEGTESQNVEIRPPPSPEQVDEAKRRAEQMQEQAAGAAKSASEEADKARSRPQGRAVDADARAEACVEARLNRGILKLDIPVYYDENGQLHHQRSAHSETYHGTRNYLDDRQRQAELRRFEQAVVDNCGQSAAEKRAQSEKYNDMLDRTYCDQIRRELAELEAQSTGIPSSRMRELRRQIAEGCE